MSEIGSKQRCLVFGGGGFLGVNLVNQLYKDGYSVRVFDRHKNNAAFNSFTDGARIEYVQGDFFNTSDIEDALDDIDYIFHLISTTVPKQSNEDPVYDIESNLLSTIKLLDVVRRKGNKKIIFISSGGTVYGIPEVIPTHESHSTNPICSYGICKLAIEKYLYLYNHLYQLDYVVLRVSNPYGIRQNPLSSQGVVPIFMHKIIHEQPIEVWGDGSVTRDFIYVKDVSDAMVAAMKSNSDYRVFNIGSGKAVSLKELIKEISDVVGKKAIVEYHPKRNMDVPHNMLDVTRAVTHLDWSPKTSLTEGLSYTYEWIQEQEFD